MDSLDMLKQMGVAKKLRQKQAAQSQAIEEQTEPVDSPQEESEEAGGQGFFKPRSQTPADKAKRDQQLLNMLKNRSTN